MPTNFPEVWENRVETNLTTENEAPWLAGVAELDTTVLEVGSGSASEQNVIHIPTTDFEPDVLINNNAYPIALQAYDDDEVTIQLDKYQTKVVTLSDDQAMGASYPRIDAATALTTRAILKKKYGKAAWALAPADNGEFTPVIQTTGIRNEGEAAITEDGRIILVYADLVALKKKFDTMQVPMDGRRLVLCSDHWNDLLLDRKRFGDMLVNYKAGDVAPVIAGFQIYQYINNPIYDGTTKQAYAAVAEEGQYQASVAFYIPNIAKKTGMTKQYFAPSSLDPQNQTNKLAYRHYFICVPKRNKYIGAIASAPAV